ncbi:hypothetical protein TPHA_0J01040 [Tetrapisispora phaffii CBS 4417]|uniref:Altered inheritance of mitochondria protein 9, mitochondrial n=1 Tax=Tetrapisispora phaffii (strain ATCC 24235 / CBS 4417 / NBRC 1672 / NRRL Y-8282 / UCD 70-5) TaxID=1071381 RepID=G8BYI4_TETPH|nr:hypothetical protein TPHA_0J01040 [Tetrapisispora phaffii CBS 4417]CCE64926.1 hypothetical protein TPHA_0J01040 [Tetrapisispora phaffii CBS 4417]
MLRSLASKQPATVARAGTALRVFNESIICSRYTKVSSRCLSNNPGKVFTKLTDDNDPKRDAFFKYSWGSWIINDKIEKERRTTKFSIEGLNTILNDLYSQSQTLAKTKKKDVVEPPCYNKNLTVSLPHNLSIENIGTINPNEKVQIVSMASLHEGKHHRIYKISTNLDKSFILRIPYPLEKEHVIAERIKSEVATMDFVDLKLDINTPKVFSFGVNKLNPLRQPFILQEFVDGTLLMRDWSPLANDTSEGKPDDKLKDVVGQVSKFHSKLISTKFNGFGSIYFTKDVKESENNEKGTPLYDNEKDESLRGRWKLGPSVDRSLWRRKDSLPVEEHKKFTGPWSASSPLDVIKSIGSLELANVKEKLLSKEKIDAAEEAILKEQESTFTNFTKISTKLINVKTKAIPNITELLEPRMNHPDLDPMNVLINDTKGAYLLDFEGTSLKPLLFQSSPQFMTYDGPKIFNLKKDIPEFDKLNESEKVQYEFMYKRTRNQHLWETKLYERHPNLISSVAPPIKMIRNPYTSMIEMKTKKDYLLVDESLMQLKEIWDVLRKNKLVDDIEFPIDYTKEQIEKHVEDLNNYHESLLSRPFAATQGWIPQDMFETLLKSKIIVKQANGDYKVEQPTQATK